MNCVITIKILFVESYQSRKFHDARCLPRVLTISPASTNVALIILRAVDLAAAFLDDLFRILQAILTQHAT